MTSDGEMTKIKVVDLEKLWNFVVHIFFIEIIYCFKIPFEIQFQNYWRTVISLFNLWLKLVTSLSPLY
jgi:hypothetical protein